MNKKFLSAILFGALMVTSTGTFVSCKDYDDDIDNLQEQINKLATKEDMTSQIASLQSALTAAQTEAGAAKTTAQEALTKANGIAATAGEAEKAAAQAAVDAAKAAVDAANAKVEAIKAAQDEVAKVKAELETAIDQKFEASKNELAKTIADLTKKVEEMTGYTTSMVTSIHFTELEWVDSDLDLNYAKVDISYPKDLAVNATKRENPSSYIFGEGLTGAFTLTDGEINTVPDHMVINVAPVNAAVSAESLSLINGQGENVDSYVNYTISTLKTNIVGSRATASTGLRYVGVQLKKDVNFEAFDKMVIPGGATHEMNVDNCKGEHEYIHYALAVTDGKSRSVNSDFDVTMHVQKEKKAVEIDKKSTIKSSIENSKSIEIYANGKDEATDKEDCYPVKLDEAFSINVSSNTKEGGRVMASYVVVDYNNSDLSVTDKAALQGINFSGVGIVSKNNSHAITVSGTYAAGVVIPLKIVSVDYTGNVEVNVVWVKANEPAALTAAYTLTPKENVATPTAWTVNTGELQKFTIPTNATKYSISMTVGETNHQTATEFRATGEAIDWKELKANNAIFLKLYKNTNKAVAAKLSEVAYAEFVGTVNLQVMREDKAYQGTVKFYDAKGAVVGTNAIKVTKVLPTAVPANFSAKTNAINNGILTIYPEPQSSKGVFNLDKAFNNRNSSNYGLKIDGITNANPVKGTYNATGYSIEDIDKNVIVPVKNNADAKAYATTVSYDYGDIKFHPEGHGVEEPGNCIVNWTAFSTKFGCMVTDSEYSWAATPNVYYREDVLIECPVYDKDGNIEKYEDIISVTDPYGKKINPFSKVAANGWSTWADALNTGNNTEIKLITNGDRVNEFFTATYKVSNGKTGIQLTKTSTEVVLSGDVETTVVLVIKDKFGHPHEVKALSFTMKKDHSGDAK